MSREEYDRDFFCRYAEELHLPQIISLRLVRRSRRLPAEGQANGEGPVLAPSYRTGASGNGSKRPHLSRSPNRPAAPAICAFPPFVGTNLNGSKRYNSGRLAPIPFRAHLSHTPENVRHLGCSPRTPAIGWDASRVQGLGDFPQARTTHLASMISASRAARFLS